MAASSSSLHGRHVLVVEDEYMIAQSVAELLSDAGVEVVGPVPSLGAALRLVAAEKQIDCAMLDVNLNGELSWPVVDVLLARGVPLLLATAYSASSIPEAYASLPRCEKPTRGRELTRALAQLLLSAGTPQEAVP